jgi:hypothetical protein
MVEPTARALDTYVHGAAVLRLMQLGHTDVPFDFYFQWPGGFIIGAVIALVADVPLVDLLQFYPIVSGFIFTIGCYILCARILGNKRSAFTATLFVLPAEIYLQLFFSPNAIASSMLPLFLLTFVLSWKNRSYAFLSLVLFVGMVIVHPVTPFMTLLVLYGMWLNLILLRSGRIPKGNLIFCTILWTGWLVFVATSALTNGSTILSSSLTTFLNMSRLDTVQQAFFQQPHPIVSYIRKGMFGFYVVLGMAGLARELKIGRRSLSFAFRSSVLIYPVLMIPLVPYIWGTVDFSTKFIVWAVFGAVMNFPFSYIIPSGSEEKREKSSGVYAPRLHIRYRSGILLVLIVCMSVLGTVTMYAEESYSMSPESTSRGAQFVALSISANTTLFTDFDDYRFYNLNVTSTSLDISYNAEIPYDYHAMINYDMIIFRLESRVRLLYMRADTTSYPRALQYVNTSSLFARIYDSGTFQAYKNNS